MTTLFRQPASLGRLTRSFLTTSRVLSAHYHHVPAFHRSSLAPNCIRYSSSKSPKKQNESKDEDEADKEQDHESVTKSDPEPKKSASDQRGSLDKSSPLSSLEGDKDNPSPQQKDPDGLSPEKRKLLNELFAAIKESSDEEMPEKAKVNFTKIIKDNSLEDAKEILKTMTGGKSTIGGLATLARAAYKSAKKGPWPELESKKADLETKGEGLSEDQKNKLDMVFKELKGKVPKSMEKEYEQIFKAMAKQGSTKDGKEFFETLDQFAKGERSLSTVAKLLRLGGKMARSVTNEEVDKIQDTKSGDKSQTSEQKKNDKSQGSKGQNPKFYEVKMDGSTLITAAITAYLFYRMIMPSENLREITWQEFRTNFLDRGLVEKLVVVNSGYVKVYVHRDSVAQQYPESPAVHDGFHYIFTIGSVEAFERKMDEAQAELGIPSSERIAVSYSNKIRWSSTFLSFGPTILFIGLLLWISRRASGGAGGGASGIFGMGKSRAKKFNHETDIQIRFKDVAGMDEAKQEIMEFVSFLKEPGQFQRLGAKIPRGAILSGPPGTGKTLLAKATAGESQVPFFSVSGSEFVEMFVGVGASRVRDLFANARKSTPCIIFIDEIDAIGKSRAKQSFGGGNDERESTLNQILTEMDGFNTSEQVVVLAGTNRPDVLDSALTRPGRFDRHITIDRPTMEGHKQIFAVHLRKILTSEDMDHLTGRLAALTPGFSGADIANCCNEAALIGTYQSCPLMLLRLIIHSIAAREKADKVMMIHFEKAIERTIGGLERKSLVLNKEERKVVAYHEAGHAICGWYFKYADPLLKVSIIPRGKGALGYAQYLPSGDTYLMNVNQLMDRMAMALGGRVSEELHFDSVTSGASDDFNKVTQMATAMVTKWGMSSKIGYIYYEEDNQKLHKPFSEETARNIDMEVHRIVDEAYKQCKDLLVEKKKEVGLVAEELLSREVLGREDMLRLLGKRPWADQKEFEQYFGGGKSAPPPPPLEGGIVPPAELPSDIPPPPPTGPESPVISKRID